MLILTHAYILPVECNQELESIANQNDSDQSKSYVQSFLQAISGSSACVGCQRTQQCTAVPLGVLPFLFFTANEWEVLLQTLAALLQSSLLKVRVMISIVVALS